MFVSFHGIGNVWLKWKRMWIERFVCHKSNDRWGKECWEKKKRKLTQCILYMLIKRLKINFSIFTHLKSSNWSHLNHLHIFFLFPIPKLIDSFSRFKISSLSFRLFTSFLPCIKQHKTLLIIKKFMTKIPPCWFNRFFSSLFFLRVIEERENFRASLTNIFLSSFFHIHWKKI